jgi:predicted metalloprotease
MLNSLTGICRTLMFTATLLLLLVQGGTDIALDGNDDDYFSGQKRVPKITRVTTSDLMKKEIVEKSNSALKLLNEYWENVFEMNNLTFRRPTVNWTAEPSAFYSGRNHNIYINFDQFVSFIRDVSERTKTDGDLAYIAVLAHEYAHAVQNILRVENRTTRESELQADCLAGSFIAHLERLHLLEEGDHDEATLIFFLARDPTGTSPDHQNAHGSGTERVNAYQIGFNGGVRSCECGLR